MRHHGLTAAALLLAGCATALPVSPSLDIDPGTAKSCARACQAVGMQVAGIVFIRNMGGCVCEPVRATSAAPRAELNQGGASAAQMGGAVLVVLEEEERQRANQAPSSSAGTPAYGPR